MADAQVVVADANGRATCPWCQRDYYVNYDGSMRRHDCIPGARHEARVILRSGGTVQVFGDFNMLTLGPDERRLVSAIADALQTYGALEPIALPEQRVIRQQDEEGKVLQDLPRMDRQT